MQRKPRTYIEELRTLIRYLHGAESEHVKSVPVKEVFKGKTVWEGIVEVFDLKGHPSASRVYAWAHDADDRRIPRRYIAVLHTHPIISAQDAVKDAIVRAFSNVGTAQEK
jgi:hypothetical protein